MVKIQEKDPLKTNSCCSSILILIISPSECVLLSSYLQLVTIPILNLSMEKRTTSPLQEVDKIELNILGGL